MPVSSDIYGSIQTPKPEDPANAMMRVLQLQGLQQDRQMGQMKMDEYQRGVQESNALRSALSADGADPYNVLIKAGKVKDATDFAKGKADVAKTGAETDAKKLEAAHKRMDIMGQTLGFVRQNPSVENATQAIQYLVQNGVMPPEKGQEAMAKFQADPSPQAIAAFADMGFRAALQAKDQLPKFETRNTGGTTDTLQIDPVTGKVAMASSVQNTQSPDNAASNARMAADAAAGRAVTVRGQNLADARSKEANAAGRVPAGYRMNAEGNLEFIPGGPADPNAAKRAAPTEFQGKAGMFGNRAQEADRIITQLEGQYSPAAINTKQALGRTPLLGGGLEYGANLALSDPSQKAEQAQRDFVNAVLRLESGAAISQGEFDNARKQYFRQPGDSDAVVAQKAQNRKTAIQGLMNNARPGAVEAAPAGPKKISSDAEFKALPSGTEFIAPDGSHRRKP